MRIYSKQGAAVEYSINLPHIGRDYWVAPQIINEANIIPTSTASAGVFRQIVKFGVSGIKKNYSVIVAAAEAATMRAMQDSTQTSWYVNNGTNIYDCCVTFNPIAISPTKSRVDIEIAVNSLVS